MKKHIYLAVILTLIFSSCSTEEPIPTYTLTVSVTPTEAGKITILPQSPDYKEGEMVTLTAEPNEHWVFKQWEGDGSGSMTPLQITMNSNKSIVGVFVKKDYTLTLTIEGEGTVEEKIVTIPGGRVYPHGTTVELTPKPKEGWVFESWGGDLTGTETPTTIKVDKEKNVTVKFQLQYLEGSIFGPSGPTKVVDVTNPKTGKTWMDRNLGASRVATSSTDAASYGDLYQWGRRADGHQLRNSATISTLSSIDQPAHGSFILAPNNPNTLAASPKDWRSPQNHNLWQRVNGVNNPCPSGYRIPTKGEWDAERLSWSSIVGGGNNGKGAFASPLKLPMAGVRSSSNGSLNPSGLPGPRGRYWSSDSSIASFNSPILGFDNNVANIYTSSRANGFSVRCIKN